MKNQKWISLDHLKRRPGAPETAARLVDLPPGPYLLVPQGNVETFEKCPTMVMFDKVSEFEVRWGHATFALGPDYMPVLVGYHYDTSD